MTYFPLLSLCFGIIGAILCARFWPPLPKDDPAAFFRAYLPLGFGFCPFYIGLNRLLPSVFSHPDNLVMEFVAAGSTLLICWFFYLKVMVPQLAKKVN